MSIAIDFKDKKEWKRIAKQYDCTLEESKKVGLLLGFRGAIGNYEEELKQLDRGPYSNEPEQWWDKIFREILAEIRTM